MAHGHKSDEKVVYVGDSRVVKRNQPLIPQDYSAYPGNSEVFIPNFLLKEWMVAAVVLVGFLVLTMSEPAPLGYPADPLTAGFIPMPDWYFLFLYQLLKYPYTSGDYVVLGTLAMPGLMFGGLLLAPFLDTGKERRFYRRPVTSALMIVSLIATVYLTAYSWHHYTSEMEAKGMIPEHIKREQEYKAAKESGQEPPSAGSKKQGVAVVAKDDPGAAVYAKATCVGCHATDLKGSGAPALLGIGDKHDKNAIMDIIKNGTKSGGMPPQYDANKEQGLTDDDLDKLANWLAMQKKEQQSAEAK